MYVADRNNNRIQVFDQDDNYISEMHQFSRPGSAARAGSWSAKMICFTRPIPHQNRSREITGWKLGIRVESLKDGKLIAFIPDPAEKATGTSAAEGAAADAADNISGAEVGPQDVKKYVKNQRR